MDHGPVLPARSHPCVRTILFPAILLSTSGHASPIDGTWADRVVYAVHEGQAIYETGVGTPLTFGPFNPANPLWQDPAAAIGPPNTIDYDDLIGFGPVPGGFAGGPMRRIHLAWPAWQWGSGNPDHLGDRPGWLDGRRQNGVGLTQAAQLVVEFDQPVSNNPDDGGAYHWGIDLIVHGNASFAATTAVAANANLNTLTLTGGVIAEPLEIVVAQSPSGPWFVADVPGDALFPTQPWAWDRAAGAWTGEPQDWSKPVDPSLTVAELTAGSAADAIDLYDGSAGGTGIDLERLTDETGNPASLDWIRFVRVRDPAGNGGEICALADVPAGPPPGSGCNAADLALPLGVLDLADIGGFVGAFSIGDPLADIADPAGVLDLADIALFVDSFVGGCP